MDLYEADPKFTGLSNEITGSHLYLGFLVCPSTCNG